MIDYSNAVYELDERIGYLMQERYLNTYDQCSVICDSNQISSCVSCTDKAQADFDKLKVNLIRLYNSNSLTEPPDLAACGHPTGYEFSEEFYDCQHVIIEDFRNSLTD